MVLKLTESLCFGFERSLRGRSSKKRLRRVMNISCMFFTRTQCDYNLYCAGLPSRVQFLPSADRFACRRDATSPPGERNGVDCRPGPTPLCCKGSSAGTLNQASRPSSPLRDPGEGCGRSSLAATRRRFLDSELQPSSRRVDMEPESSGRGSSKKVSRVPTAISREEEKEEGKEEIVVPDTLLLSISPDLVTPLSLLSI